MKKNNRKAIAAAMVATIAASLTFSGCEGRKMSNMTPDGETVQVVIDEPQSDSSTGNFLTGSASDNDL